MTANPRPASSAGGTRRLTAMAVAVALAVLLGFIRLYRLPWGGSLSLKILPLVYLAVTHGPRAGMAGGLAAGLVTLIVDPVILHPIQVALDYLLPYALIGVIGWFPGWPRAGILVAGVLRLASHVVSGAVYFAAFTPPELNRQVYELIRDYTGIALSPLLQEWTAPWLYALLYNASVVVPETILMILFAPPLIRRLNRSFAPDRTVGRGSADRRDRTG